MPVSRIRKVAFIIFDEGSYKERRKSGGSIDAAQWKKTLPASGFKDQLYILLDKVS